MRLPAACPFDPNEGFTIKLIGFGCQFQFFHINFSSKIDACSMIIRPLMVKMTMRTCSRR